MPKGISPTTTAQLIVTCEDIERARKWFNVTPEDIDNDVQAIKQWFKQQPHLPNIELNADVVERILIGCKYSIEKTKSSIDSLYTFRNILPELFSERNPLELLRKAKLSGLTIPTPLLDKDGVRVNIVVVEKDVEKFKDIDIFLFGFLMREYRFYKDYMRGERYLYDFKNCTFGHILKLHPSVISKAEIAQKKVFGTKLLGLHFLNAGPFIEKVLPIFRAALKPKLASRIHFHDSLEDLHKHIDKEILPSDFGGDAPSLDKLTCQWEDLFKTNEFEQWVNEHNRHKSDESKRTGEQFTSDIFGIPGSFRKLNVD